MSTVSTSLRASTPAPAATSESAAPSRIQRVLIVDDCAYGRSMLELHAGRVWPDATFEKCDGQSDPFEGDPASAGFDLAFISQDIGPQPDSYADWLRMLNTATPAPISVVVAAESSERSAIKAIKRGADDYLDKSLVSAARLKALVEESQSMREELLDTSGDTLYKTWRMDGDTATLLRERLHGLKLDEPAPGQGPRRRVPGYENLTLIGKGAMAEAWRARRVCDDLDVVLKILPFNDADAASLLKQFMREYEFIGEIKHPHIARIYERAFATDFAYIAMELLPGGDLATRVAKGVAPEEAMDFIVQIARGLEAAHARGIVHRDLKP
ncbi:MAG: protein kinase, partial [Gammaproteobacteria bacterium]|nr:protein kinase [Gammaproteobacteria bacterium]